jgi:hypothetical protein
MVAPAYIIGMVAMFFTASSYKVFLERHDPSLLLHEILDIEAGTLTRILHDAHAC